MDFVWGLLTGAGSVTVMSLYVKQYAPFKRRHKATSTANTPRGISNLALYCSCEHISNVHNAEGRCLADVFTGNRWAVCKCQRYNGPMGLQELELWGPPELRSSPAPQQRPAVESADVVKSEAWAWGLAEQLAAIAALERGLQRLPRPIVSGVTYE